MKKLLLACLLVTACLTPALAQAPSQKYDSGVSTNSTLVRAGAAQLAWLVATNSTATVYYLKLYDLAVAPTCNSSTVAFKIAVPATASGGQVVIHFFNLGGMQFFNGIGFCLTGAIGDTDNSNAATGVTMNFGVRQ